MAHFHLATLVAEPRLTPISSPLLLHSFFFQSKEIYARARVASVIAGVIGMLASAFAVAWITFGGEQWTTNSVMALVAIFCRSFSLLLLSCTRV